MSANSMPFVLGEAMEVLSRTPAVLTAMLAGLSQPWVRNNYGENTFSPFDVVGHLIHGERTDWMPRARMILEHGEARAFEPFDRYAMYQASVGCSLEELLTTFDRLRNESLAELRAMKLDETRLDCRGTHPALGTVTLRELLATWVVHDLNHVHQVAKSMAHQYRGSVGAWRAYLSILPPAG